VSAARVAVLTDLHGNLPALEAVLASVKKLGAGRLVCGGCRPALGGLDAGEHRSGGQGLHGAAPFDLRFEVGGRRVRLVHGSPRKVNEYLFEDKPARTFERIAALADCDMLVFGHTHKPWVHEYGGVLFVNCGSVGKPKDGDPRAAYAVLEAEDGTVRVSIERVAYDAEAVAREMRSVGLPDELAEKLVTAT